MSTEKKSNKQTILIGLAIAAILLGVILGIAYDGALRVRGIGLVVSGIGLLVVMAVPDEEVGCYGPLFGMILIAGGITAFSLGRFPDWFQQFIQHCLKFL